jgi:hypothetical protein
MHLPRKRAILAFHRWLGFLSATFLLILSITGFALNHTEWFRLDHVKIRNSVILKRYGMIGGEAIQSYRINEKNTVSVVNGRLFLNQEPVADTGKIVGIFEGDPINVVVTVPYLILFTVDGEWVETLGTGQLPFENLSALGYASDGRAVLVAENGNWMADEDWLNFKPYEGSYTVPPLEPTLLDPNLRSALLMSYQGGGISLYRFLLDVHSGRFLGWGGRTAMDLTAVAIVILISSGIAGWLRKSRSKTKSPRN